MVGVGADGRNGAVVDEGESRCLWSVDQQGPRNHGGGEDVA